MSETGCLPLRRLGSSGLLVSSLGLGTMTFGDTADEAASHAILDRYVAAGGNLVDTADVYSAGGSEEIVGRWLAHRGRRERVVLATKLWSPMGPTANDAGLSARRIRAAVHDSLRRLQTDYIDLYQAHAWDPLTPLDETLTAFDRLVREGTVRYVGLSNVTGWQAATAMQRTESLGAAPIVTVQAQYNLLVRDVELEILPAVRHAGRGLIAWGPLSGGWLTGKLRPERPLPTGTRVGDEPDRLVDSPAARDNARTAETLDVLGRVAAQHGASMSQAALSWLTAQDGVTAALVGARNLVQLDDNLGAAAVHLDPTQLSALDRASAPPQPEYYSVMRALADQRASALAR